MHINSGGSSKSWQHTAGVVAPYAFLFFWCWIIFWRGRVALPTEDQTAVMWERVFSTSDWSFFGKLLSFNRTRVVNAGDMYLFRPATHALIAAGDIFFREKLIWGGYFSILFLSLMACVSFYWLSALTERLWGFLLSLVLVTPFAASKIVLWRHISGYILCPLVLTLALIAMQRKSFRIAGGLFFLSALFHEAAPLALLLSALVIAFIPNVENRKAYVMTLLIPTLLFVGWSIADFLYHQGTISPFGAGPSAATANALGNPMINVVYFTGIAAVAHLVPSWVHFQKSADETVYWNFSDISYPTGIAFGLALIFLIVFVIRKRRELPIAPWVIPTSFLVVVVLSLVIGRAVPRGWDYLYRSPYYFFFTSWSTTALLALALRFCKPKAPRVVAALLLTLVAGLSAFHLTSYLSTKHGNELEVARLIEGTSALLEAHPEWCYSGSTDTYLHTFDPLIFYRRSCGAHAGQPMVTGVDPQRRLVVKPVGALPGKTIPLKPAETVNQAIGKALGKPSHLNLSPPSAPLSAISIGPIPMGTASFLFNFEGKNRFQILFVEQNRVFQVQWNDGKIESATLVGYLTRQEASHLTLRTVDNRVWMWWGENIVGVLANVTALKGQFGVLCAPNLSCPQTLDWNEALEKDLGLVTSNVFVPEALPQLIPSNF